MIPSSAGFAADPPAKLASGALAALRIAGFLAWVIACMPIQVVLLAVSRRAATAFPVFFHRRLARILGFRIRVIGARRKGPTLFVANHLSYIDIVILGASVYGSFVSKAEVRGWPIFGQLAMLQRTVFIRRERAAAKAQAEEINARLAAGDSLLVFPEGTSSDGAGVLAFKSSLLSVAAARPNGEPVAVQPVTLVYDRLDGMPAGRFLRPFIAWYGDMDLAGHAPTLLGLGVVGATVIFHPPLTLEAAGDRKTLARLCEQAVRAGYESALRGRPRPARPAREATGAGS